MKKLSLVLLSLLTSIASADHNEVGTVNNIILESNILSVWLNGPDVTTDCSGGSRWTMTTEDPLFKEKYSAILAAAASGKTVDFRHVTSSGCGFVNGNKIYFVKVIF